MHVPALGGRTHEKGSCAHRWVRCDALWVLSQLAPSDFARHSGRIAVMLEDADSGVRNAAAWALAKLEPPALARHAGLILARIDDFDSTVRRAALESLGKLGPPPAGLEWRQTITLLYYCTSNSLVQYAGPAAG